MDSHCIYIHIYNINKIITEEEVLDLKERGGHERSEME